MSNSFNAKASIDVAGRRFEIFRVNAIGGTGVTAIGGTGRSKVSAIGGPGVNAVGDTGRRHVMLLGPVEAVDQSQGTITVLGRKLRLPTAGESATNILAAYARATTR